MPSPESLAGQYAFTTMLASRHLDGITQTQSVFQPSGGANCLNFVAGHILQHRGLALRLLGAAPEWQPRLDRYATGSAPITTDGDGETIDSLRALLESSRDALAAALAAAGEAGLARIVEDRGQTQAIGDHVAGLHWHETFHLGQLDVLRALSLAGAP